MRPKSHDPAVVIAVAWTATPLLLSLSVGSSAVARYCTSQPLWFCAVAMLLFSLWPATTLILRASSGVGRAPAASAAVLSTLGCLLLWWRLWNPELDGMATIGGGDAGHHVWIANQLAGEHPRVYQGFTTFHASAWIFAQLLGGGPFEGVRAAFYVGIAGWLSAGALLVVVLTRDCRSPLLATLIGGATLVGVWLRLHLSWAHYYQADGFYAHIHGAALVPLLLVVVAVVRVWHRRAVALGVVVVLYRFTYALNAGDVLLACAGVVAIDVRLNWRTAPRLAKTFGAGAALSVLVAAAAFAMLLPKFGKPGGIMAPDATLNLGALLCGTGAAMLWVFANSPSGADRPSTRAARLAAYLAVVPIAVQLFYLGHPDWPREYYFHKYATNALFALTGLAPVLVGLGAEHLILAPRTARSIREFATLTVAVCVLCGASVRFADKASANLLDSYRRRAATVKPLAHVLRLHDSAAERIARSVMRQTQAREVVFQHPVWPVFNFSDNVLNAWKPAPKRPVKGLQDERWRLFLSGKMPTAGECVFWPDSDQNRTDFEGVATRHPNSEVASVVAKLSADATKQCRAIRPGEPLCWVCR